MVHTLTLQTLALLVTTASLTPISDGKGGEDTATVNLVVSDKVDPNNAPDAVDDNGAGDKNEDITGNVLGNDTDPDGDDLTATLTTGPANGSVVLNDDGSYTYTPNAGFVGNDSFTYTISDGKGGEDTATVNLVVSDKVDPNNAPDAVDDNGAGDKNEDITGNVLGNDTDPDGDDLTATLTTGPANGSVVLNDDGSYTYTPNTGFVGNDSFTYTISDGKGGEDTATVNLVVSDKVDPNNAPDAVDDNGAGDKNEDITGNVLGNDTDPDGDDLTATLTTGPANGSVVLNDDGSYTYTPNAGFVGNDSFTYTISDGKGGEDTATVNLVVSDKVDPNNAPDAVDDNGAGDKNEDITGNVLGNDTDPDGDDLTATLTTGPANGSVVLNDDGSYTYTPNAGFVGNDSFTYTISDGKGGEDTATVNLVVSDKVDPNNAPDAVDDNGAGDKNEDITGNVLGNDTDPDGDDLTATLTTGPANGSVVLNDDGSYTYTPNTGFVGNDSFTYTISDGKGGEDTATVNLVVSDAVDPNNAPDAVDDSETTDYGTPVSGNVLGNDSDPDGDDLTATLATGPTNGSVVLNDDGSYTYTPDDGFSGEDTFTYTIDDGNGGTDTATVTITVGEEQNQDPDAVDDANTTTEGTPVSGSVLDNDSDPDGDDLTATLATGPLNGSVVLNDDGTYTYTPDDGFTGNDSFTYTISDGNGGEDTATVVISVSDAPNQDPDAVDDSETTDYGTPVSGNVLGNDSDPDGDDLTATLATGPANGSVVLNDDGSYTYTPDDGFSGEDTFTYTIDDGNGGTDTATVTITVGEEQNQDPDAVDDANTTTEGTPVSGSVLDNDSDPDGDDLTATLATGPLNGSVVLNDDGTYTYTPDDGFTGNDSFTYTISDGNGGEDTATVVISVSDAPNQDPDAVDDSETTDYGTPVSGNVLGNDSDPDGDDLTATLATGPLNGSVVLNDDGSYTYTPDDGFSGEDTFTYTIDDGNGGTDTATVTITVGEEQNQDPDAVDDANTTTEGTPVSGSVLDNDSDPDGDDLTATLATGPLNGSVVLNDDGTYTYTPDDGFTGNDSFTYTISDGNGGEDTATVVINVSDAPNQDPDAVDDSETTDYGTPVSGNVLGNDSDPDGDDLTATLATGPLNGSVVLNDDGSYTYTPDDGFSGEDTFTYTIDDGNGGTDTATVTITVGEEKNQDPDAVDDANTTTEGTPVSGSVLDNDSDPDGDDLTATLATGPLNGSVVLNDDGTYTYTPDDGFTGNDSFTYTISDGKGGEDTATVVINVSDAPNQDPDAVDDSETTDYGTPVSGNVLGNDSDPDGDDLTATLATGPLNGSVVLNDDGTYTYTPDDGFTGNDSFTYTISDGNGGEDTATVVISVSDAPNQDPDAVDDSETTDYGTPVSGNVLGNDSDPDGDDLTATLATGPLNGSVVLNDDGSYTYTPDDGFSGEDTFTYTIDDGNGGTDTATVTITVGEEQNQDPDAVDDANTTTEGTPVSGSVLDNDSDPDGDDLTATLATGPLNGSVVLNDDGTYTYTPDDGFTGNDSFTYTISDGNGGEDTATVVINVSDAPNQDPDAVDDSETTDYGTPVSGNVLGNDSDPDGDDLTATLATGPTNGSVVLNDDGSYTYTPDDGFSGEDTFTYTIDDGNGGTDTATVTITVGEEKNQDPDAVDDANTTTEGTPVSGSVLDNDSDPDGDDLTATLATGPLNGSVVLNDDGTYTYTPDDGFTGNDSFTYTISDGKGGEDTATVVISVSDAPNQDPDAVDDSETTDYGTPVSGNVLGNDTDPDGDDLTATLATGPLNGSVVLNDDGSYTYTPDDGFSGEDTFTYTIDDGNGGTDTATVTITVGEEKNQDPDAVDDANTTTEGTPVSGSVLDNDSDPDGDDLTATLATGPLNGSVVLNDDGTYTYTPDDGFTGNDSFTYTISDGKGGEDTATVVISVSDAPNQDPDAVDDSETTDYGTPVSGNVLGNDTDPDGDDLTATLATGPLNGSVVLNDDGSYTYTPDDGFSGEDTFTYTIDDGNGGTDTATVTITVGEEKNQDPDAVDDANTTTEGTPVSGSVLDNDSDPDGDDLTATLATGPLNGSVVLNDDGTYTYTPDDGFTGNDSFTYTISDGKGGEDTATVVISVSDAPNQDPDAVDDSETTDYGTPVSGNVLGNDTDPDGDDLTATLATGPTNGSVVLNDDGSYTYTPDDGFSGEDTFTYTIDDGNGGTDTATVTITVGEEKNQDPDAVDDANTTTEGTPVSGSVLDNDSDPDGDDLTATLATGPLNGSVVLNDDGTYTYTPDDGFTGNDSFTYTISDGKGGEDTATVVISVSDAPNQDPDAVDDSETTDYGTPVSGNVLGNDTDPDGDDLTATLATGPLNGSVVLNDDGSYTYTPDDGFSGEDTFTYTIDDGNGGTDTATVTITVGDKTNQDPIAEDDAEDTAFETPVTGNVLDNDSDPDGDDLTATLATGPSNGSVVLNEDGSYTYTPDDGFSGDDSFTYTISDGNGGTDTATVFIWVAEDDNQDPDAVDDAEDTAFETPVSGNVLDNDSDPDGDDLTATLATGPSNGSVVLNEDGSYTYTPDDGFYGDDSFTYTIDDGNGGTDTATVSIWVAEPTKINAEIVGEDMIWEGEAESYKVQLDQEVTQDTWFAIEVNDGSANRIDRNDYDVANQDIIWGGYFDTRYADGTIANVYWDKVPFYNYDGSWSYRDAVGPNGTDNWDYTVMNEGVVYADGKFYVKVEAGETMSDSFDIKSWSEQFTVDRDSDFTKNNPNYEEGDETLTINLVGTAGNDNDVITADDSLEVTIVDETNYKFVSPIALDLNGDGQINVTGSSTAKDSDREEIGATVEFDIDGDGDLDTIEWLDGSGDALLVDNRDGNAASDMDGARLFGDQGGLYANGFEKLSALDANGDGTLNGDELEGLELWVDDGDAIVEEGEMQTLTQHGITEISVEMNEVVDADGNTLMRSTATTQDGRTILSEDVWFASEIEDEAADETDIMPIIVDDWSAAG